MASFLLESYAARSGVDDLRERARRAADLGTGIRYVRTTFVPDDETVLHVFEAMSFDALQAAVRMAELPYERIAEAVEGPELLEQSAP